MIRTYHTLRWMLEIGFTTGKPESQQHTGSQIIRICMEIYLKIDKTVKMAFIGQETVRKQQRHNFLWRMYTLIAVFVHFNYFLGFTSVNIDHAVLTFACFTFHSGTRKIQSFNKGVSFPEYHVWLVIVSSLLLRLVTSFKMLLLYHFSVCIL